MHDAAASVRGLGGSETGVRDLEELELLRRVIANDPAAWREFIRRFEPVIRHQIGRSIWPHRAALSSDSMADVLGEFWIYVLKNDRAALRAYDPAKGSRLSSWLGMLAMQTAWKHVRKQRSHLAVLPVRDHDDDPGRGARFVAFERSIRDEACWQATKRKRSRVH